MINESIDRNINTFCAQCKGQYWNDDSSIRHSRVMEEFGIIPNPCVGSLSKSVKCPYRKIVSLIKSTKYAYKKKVSSHE